MDQEMIERTKASYFERIRRDPKSEAVKLKFADWCDTVGEAELAKDLRGRSEDWLREFVSEWNPQDYLDDVAEYYGRKKKDPLKDIRELVDKAWDDGSKPKKRKPFPLSDEQEEIYESLLEEAVSPDEYFTAHGRDIHSRSELDPGDEELFWHHMHVMTGYDFDESHKESFGWSCTC